VILVGQQIAATPNRTCDKQQIGHEIAHEIPRVISPLISNSQTVSPFHNLPIFLFQLFPKQLFVSVPDLWFFFRRCRHPQGVALFLLLSNRVGQRRDTVAKDAGKHLQVAKQPGNEDY
jgi:hypothetical protein